MRLRRIVSATALGGLALALTSMPAPLRAQAPVALAEAPAPTRYADAIAHARMIAQAIISESRIPGLSVAVALDGAIVWSEGFGYADLEHRVPVWEETRFRIGSVSKSMTAAALGKLYEDGLLDLDAPVQRYVPSFPEKRWPITTRQLAGHLAGVRHYRDQEFLSNERYENVLQGLEIFQDDTLLFEPGTRYSYSTYGWNLISAVVEGASGQDFLTYIQENVFDPLGLDHTVADHTDSIIPHRTRFYALDDDARVLNAPFVDNSYKWAGGGFLSTTEELVRFGSAHLEPGFLKPETIELLWTSQRTSDGEETGYGIGWRVGTDRDGRRVVNHSGGSIGGITFLLIFPDDGVVVATLANLSEAGTGYNVAHAIAEPFLGPMERTVGDPESLPDHAGAYACTALSNGEEPTSGKLWLAGAPGDYWGRVVFDDTPARVVYSSASRDATRILAVTNRGSVLNLWLAGAEGAPGRWSSRGREGELRCERR